MSEVLLFYVRPDPRTWVYFSSFLTLGLFFVFHRFWSIRNLDMFLLILLAPGPMIVHEGYSRSLAEIERSSSEAAVSEEKELVVPPAGDVDGSEVLATEEPPIADNARPNADADQAVADESDRPQDDIQESKMTPVEIRRVGFVFLFAVQALLLIRLMCDPLMVRRPLLDPNLTSGGLTFIGIFLFLFMMANVANSNASVQARQGPALGPGYALMNMLPAISTRPDSTMGRVAIDLDDDSQTTASEQNLARVAKCLAIAAQLAIITGIVLIGSRHFGNMRAGVGCATLYLLLPYTAQMTGRVDHAVPSALLLWAILTYRRPAIAGIFLGLACGLVYYPMFLLPLWFSFYWQRGSRAFAISVLAMLGLLVVALSVDGTASLGEHLQRMFGLLNPNKSELEMRGFWQIGPNPIWRLPVIVGFVILSVFFAIWPAQKNLATLMSASAAIMVAAQFWHGDGGGLYIAWFLPLLLLTIFRPNLQDRVATKVVAMRGRRSTVSLEQ